MGERWTDERLDDFRGEVSRRFDKVDRRFDTVEGEIGELRTEMNTRFDGLQRTMLLLCGGIIAALIGLLGTAIFAVVQM
ncbi:MAG TPA: hypothetical protein VFC52_04475 [Solirubrobacterales bacterium]|nr:hypothetical protein [Solirubrobacterales bacterium]